jgi:secondary thiamine-phosphate synthase enzyme
MIRELSINTGARAVMLNVTQVVQDVVRESGVREGSCHLFVPHTTAAVTVNEQADPSVVRDMLAQLERMVPERTDYEHAEGNSPAHVKCSLIGVSQVLAVTGGRLALGTWQGIFFCEFDGPRQRQLLVKAAADQMG